MSRGRILLLGCGGGEWDVAVTGFMDDDFDIYGLDINPDVDPDYLFDLEQIEQGEPLPGGPWDEIHAYEVMEHFGRQGDYKGFFIGMCMIWDALKEGGLFVTTSPPWDSEWAWGDPGHTRILGVHQYSYVCHNAYVSNREEGTAMTDYCRYVHPKWWKFVINQELRQGQYALGFKKEVGLDHPFSDTS